jgi:hypothetical protein
MTLRLEISEQAAETLRLAWGSEISRAALEALAIEGYRSGKLSRYDVQCLLGFEDRWQTETWLGAHGGHVNYSIEDLTADRDALNRALGSTTS